MLLTVSEFPNERQSFDIAFDRLAAHVAQTKSDLVILPEMPFTPWIFGDEVFSEPLWREAVEAHDRWLDFWVREIDVPLLTSRPIDRAGKRQNEAFFLDRKGTYRTLRSKCYLPNDGPARERVWFVEGENPAQIFDLDEFRVGIQLCSEMLYMEIPRLLGSKDVELIVQPRATGNHQRWKVATQAAAITSGSFVASCNRRSDDDQAFAGGCWVFSPEGELLVSTKREDSIATVDLDLSLIRAAKQIYPQTMYTHYRM